MNSPLLVKDLVPFFKAHNLDLSHLQNYTAAFAAHETTTSGAETTDTTDYAGPYPFKPRDELLEQVHVGLTKDTTGVNRLNTDMRRSRFQVCLNTLSYFDYVSPRESFVDKSVTAIYFFIRETEPFPVVPIIRQLSIHLRRSTT